MNVTEIALNQVDELGMLLAQIADLTAKADAIKDSIKDAATSGGDKVYEGAMYKATFMESNRSTIDYKKLCSDLGVSTDVLSKYTKVTAVFSVKTTSR